MKNVFKQMRWDAEEKETLLYVLGAMGAGAFFVVGAALGCYFGIWVC